MLFHRLASRVAVEWQFSGEVFRRLTAEIESEDLIDLCDRLALIFDILVPVREESREAP